MVTKLEGDNQGGEKIQGILEEEYQNYGHLGRGIEAYFQVWPPSFCDLHHMGGSCLGGCFWHGWEGRRFERRLGGLRGGEKGRMGEGEEEEGGGEGG